jgi:hypothetical protein
MKFDAVQSCRDVDDAVVRQALAPAHTMSEPSPREKILALVRHMTSIARPGEGGAGVLVVLAQMAKRSWLEGRLVVRLIGDAELSVLELLVDDGVSSERLLPPTQMDVPLAEFSLMLTTHAAELRPLVPREKPTDRRIVLIGMPDYRVANRKASISAFDTSLLGAARGGQVSAPEPSEPAEPDDALASYDRPSAILEIPESLGGARDESGAIEPAARRGPPPPPRRKA